MSGRDAVEVMGAVAASHANIGCRVDMRAEAEAAFQDTDFELLFDPRWDGLEEDEAVSHLAMANLRFEDWFRPFRDEIPVHPYIAEP